MKTILVTICRALVYLFSSDRIAATSRKPAFGMLLLYVGLALSAPVSAQTWTALNNQPSFRADNPLLLTDGTIMVHQYETSNWWRLTPDTTGSYINGTWTQLASMPSNYGPLYFASAVLADGRVVVEGGEYNFGTEDETNLGAIYNPATNAWTAITAPSGWSEIGDGQSVVLANGTFMLGNCCYSTQALLNATSLTWTATGTGKADSNSEEGWNLLSNGEVLAVDVGDGTNSELYNASTGAWTSAGSTGVELANANCYEIGPAVLRPNGTVFATGGLSATANYNSATGVWTAGPSFPSGLGVNDGPAAILPDGNVLVSASPISPCYANGTQFFEFNGTSLTAVPSPPNAANQASFQGNMLVLPSLQVMYTNQSTGIEIYTPAGTYESAWQPTISSVASTLTVGSTNNSITGTQFNGLSQGGAYGDDNQSASNYPLVRLVNNSTGDVYYAKTHNHSTMGVATGETSVSTEFDIPADMPAGIAQLYVVANGIPSAAAAVTIVEPSEPWQFQAQRIQYENCYTGFDLFLNQESSGGLNWIFNLFSNGDIKDITNPVFSWTLSDSQGNIATGNWSSAQNGVAFPVSRLPVGTPSFTLNGYWNFPGNGPSDPACSEPLTGSGTITQQ